MELAVFNSLDNSEAADVLRPCIDIDRWVNELIAARPFTDVGDLTQAAERSANPFTAQEIEAALAHHPRIGERAAGESAEAKLSRNEQAALNLDEDVNARLIEANRAYEERFSRVFLIRAAGRTTEEILAECQRRLGNDDDTELREVAEQLRAIAVLRLSNAVQN
ncbi:2-oxo-4-hydroxy-4-carboxy-5-ureidoimidazoline decarboxylase [Glutamicibacter creatinolyticus]|uniref:2-oxo-4-hydroxy-4-carboxy-5-ureidoimidazoline decarboxylase n=1 Tax=Glutamicibacter creatinolyticus TaxID=162496 RepID=UPI003B986C9F